MIEPKLSEKNKKEFLTFLLNNERYGIDLLAIKEIKATKDITYTQMMELPFFIKGVMFAYDHIIPIINLRKFYQLDNLPDETFNIVIITFFENNYFAFEVDALADIISLETSAIKKTPQNLGEKQEMYIEKVGVLDNELLKILDLKKMLTLSSMVKEKYDNNNAI